MLSRFFMLVGIIACALLSLGVGGYLLFWLILWVRLFVLDPLSELIVEIRKTFRGPITAEQIEAERKKIYDARAQSVMRRFTRNQVSIINGDVLLAEEIDAEFGPAPWRS